MKLIKGIFVIAVLSVLTFSCDQAKKDATDAVDAVENAADATVEGCKYDLGWGWNILFYLESTYPERVMRVRMEDVILDIKKECKMMCNFLNIPFEEDMCFPHLRMRAKEKRNRYFFNKNH